MSPSERLAKLEHFHSIAAGYWWLRWLTLPLYPRLRHTGSHPPRAYSGGLTSNRLDSYRLNEQTSQPRPALSPRRYRGRRHTESVLLRWSKAPYRRLPPARPFRPRKRCDLPPSRHAT